MTQTWLAETPSADRLTYEAVFCLACSQQHFICAATGRALGDTNVAVTKVRGPTFPPKQIQKCHDRVASPLDEISHRAPGVATERACNYQKLH
ncbi:hypothetical protein [Rhodopseudomonas sp.]|uniref:hypothetical protein n=1 Tax=Rhodopseudomonas sp. TaxID=1078 RepID=UPI0026013A90|nr:hypothetical protein [Rhodopseudomonas sp.]